MGFWSKSRHRIWSRSTSNGLLVVDDECKFCEAGSDCGQDHTDHDQLCCGDFEKGTRFPVRTHGGAMDCCNDGANGGYEWLDKMNQPKHEKGIFERPSRASSTSTRWLGTRATVTC